jgi:signal transduction histidine kinase/DNA-binding response OmpR family regulator
LITDFACDKFNAMTDNGHGHLVISAFSKGILDYDKITRTLIHHDMASAEDSLHGGLCNNWVMTVISDHDGRVWIGTASGVSCYEPQTRSFRPFGWQVQAEAIRCLSLCETRQGDMLMGTSQGLFIWHRQSNQTEPFPHSEQLRSQVISYIVEDNSGDLWCSSTNGIWHYQAAQKHWVNYVSGSGLTSHEYVNSAGLHTTEDRIFFPTSDGLTTFSPQQLKSLQIEPKELLLTNFYIAGHAVSTLTLSNDHQVTSLPVSQSDRFTVSHLDNNITLEFSLLDYADASNVVIEHRFDNRDWIVGKIGQNNIDLSHLASGTYHLEVRAREDGVLSPSRIITIEVLAPWYRTTFAYLIYILGVLTLLGLLVMIWWRHVKLNVEEDKMKFLINATHDIRSPLTLIMGGIGKLKKVTTDNEPKEAITTIESNAQRILNLVNQILDVRKIDKQQMHLHCQQTDLKDFLQMSCKLYEFTAHERGITFTLDADDDVPPVWIDRTQFDKVVSNLLSNAFKYSYDMGEITVTLSQGQDDHAREPLKRYVQISITDTGTGMREGTLQHLFDRFYQGTTDKSAHVQGTGIGLNLCKMIVDMHHGTIAGSNRQDGIKGSVFTVRLPQGNSHLSEGEIDYHKDEPTSIRLKGKQKAATAYQILLVDDDEEIPRYISQELGHYYHFTMCRNGKDGLRELLTNTSYDLVISDVMMPEMDGFTMLRMIRTNGQVNHLPVIMLTSKTDIGNRLEGLERGADAYLTKPFSIEELHATIDNLIASRQRLHGKYSGTQMPNEQIKKIEVKGNDEQLMERIVDSINKHISDSDFTVETLCEEVGISRANLHRKMKAMTGITATDFMRNIRMEQAARLLSEQKVNITQVAYSVGFSSLPYFSTAFKKHFGVSPTEYIENQQ